MLTGRPGARNAVPGLGTDSSDTCGRAPLSPQESGGRHRPGAYLDMKIHLEKNLEEERQILLQQQKICRNRARKYFVESNRRKKAFEEKRKEQEEKEYQIREKILQQRKQKFEEVTEKFQRGHIPLSQRRRAVFQKPVPPLEEALKQIQESNLKSELNLPFSHRTTINWKAIDSALPSALSKNDHKYQTHLLSKNDDNKEMKENSRTNLVSKKNVFQLKLEETEKLLKDQHLSSLQKFCDEVNRITNSETLSSIDSLEVGEREDIYLTLNKESSTSIQPNSLSLGSANLQSANPSCFVEDKLSFSKTQHINNWLTNLDAPTTHAAAPFSDILSKSNVPSWEHLISKKQSPSTFSTTMERATSTANNSVAFVYSPPVFEADKKRGNSSETSTRSTTDCTSEAFKNEKPLVTESPTFRFSKAWTAPDYVAQEVATFSDQQKHSEETQTNRTTSVPTSFLSATTPLVLPSNTQSARPLAKSGIHVKEINPVQCSDKLDELKDVKDEKIKYFNCNKEELPLFSSLKDKKQRASETLTSLSNIISNYDLVGQHKKMKYNIHERNGVRFLKSILKKESKYEHDYLKTIIINQGFTFGNQKASAIRDSIELTKQKGKGTEIPKTIKKLRWFDETSNIENNAEDSHSLKNRTGITQQWSPEFHTESDADSNIISIPACAVNSDDRKKSKDISVSDNATSLGRHGTDHVPLNCFLPSGYNLAKQAWSASAKEESNIPVHISDSKTQKDDPQRGGAKVIRRAGSAKVQPGCIYTNRKGTVIQPPSASKAKTFIQTQGKLMIPHPPPKPTSNIRSGKNKQMSHCQSVMPENSQNIIGYNCFNSTHLLPKEPNLNQWNQKRSPLLSDACSDLVTVIPSLPSYYSSECHTLPKTNHSNGAQMIAQQDGTLYCSQNSPVSEESYQSVTLKTMEEESVLLWKRGNNTLHQNERPTDSTVTRRKRIVGNKQRNIFAQKKQNPGSVRQKYSEQINNFGPSVQLVSSEPKQTIRGTSNIDEVSDSTSEFLMAENLVNASVPEDEILALIKSKQREKPSLALNKTQQFNICALSAEEQKILQSLDHLNERLHYLQETMGKHSSIKNTFQIIPFLSSKGKKHLWKRDSCAGL
ncbi:centrosomal protein of 126 kDa isoform X2 [Oryctolagus cuniculus]|uniref:centrosomal protein of 126 kDa isoform X2 n=1 Tax=Oryctolagus cuniculus TaxID=9986 RepID=UPI0022308185|nr:centrosomal protein of 126 kDa isoform X2 [Oryctolagus cuniculus]